MTNSHFEKHKVKNKLKAVWGIKDFFVLLGILDCLTEN